MTRRSPKGVGRLSAILASAGVLTVAFLSAPPDSSGQSAGAGGVKRVGPAEDFIKLGMQFNGAESCSNADCHGAPARKIDPKAATTLAEYTEWAAGDPHKKAFETLVAPESEAIAKKLKIADATTSERCTSCHALAVPDKLQGAQFNIQEGVTCNSCHGPSGKWLEPHAKAGWTEKERAAAKTHDALLKKWGLFDTKNPLARAEKCTSCHLAIDADMVAAGHPQPLFELAYYSKSVDQGGAYESQHWRDPNVPFYTAQLWATGQVVALRDAMIQLAQRAAGKDAQATQATQAAYEQAMGHVSVWPGLTAAGVVPANSGVEAAVKALTGAMQAKNMQQVAAAAGQAAAAADKQLAAVAKWKPAQASVAAGLQAVANNSAAVAAAGEHGVNQQSLAIYDLYSSYAETTKAANRAAVEKAILDTLFPETPLTAQQFPAAVKKIQGQLPKQ